MAQGRVETGQLNELRLNDLGQLLKHYMVSEPLVSLIPLHSLPLGLSPEQFASLPQGESGPHPCKSDRRLAVTREPLQPRWLTARASFLLLLHCSVHFWLTGVHVLTWGPGLLPAWGSYLPLEVLCSSSSQVGMQTGEKIDIHLINFMHTVLPVTFPLFHRPSSTTKVTCNRQRHQGKEWSCKRGEKEIEFDECC